MNKTYLLVFAFLMSACGSQVPTLSPEAIKETAISGAWTEIVGSYTATPAFTATPVPTDTPAFTNTPEATATITNTPEPTISPLLTDKHRGFYLVNVDIAPGIWKSSGSDDGCYWAVTTANGDIMQNHFGMSGGTMFVASDGFQVELGDCGTWTYLGPG